MSDAILTPDQFEQILPLAAAWAEEEERRILESGITLTPAQTNDARAVGVAHPERVRLLVVDAIPMPEHPVLRAAGAATGLMSPFTAGLTLRYGIYIRGDLDGDRALIAHELVHTGQYERHGSIPAFLRQYLHECLTIGYPAAPMEQEAIIVSERVLREPS
ncbi:MAG TPA: hypothetical protein VK961_08635 [Chthoniobacter sp.]|nr:hypothetical protein [Chthoniobacter sp.]